ncbi:hypothetical protein HDU86_006485 [Geranomyces michiganensis]|nr:hypothetical protein HDU86_006485 [Geranomyces michiganensis]
MLSKLSMLSKNPIGSFGSAADAAESCIVVASGKPLTSDSKSIAEVSNVAVAGVVGLSAPDLSPALPVIEYADVTDWKSIKEGSQAETENASRNEAEAVGNDAQADDDDDVDEDETPAMKAEVEELDAAGAASVVLSASGAADAGAEVAAGGSSET